MKIIDLLNKIANGEEVPKHIKHYGAVYSIIYFESTNSIDYEDIKSGDLLIADRLILNERLNDEIEIIEEEKKIPEKWNDLSFTTMRNQDDIEHLKGYIETIMRTQNEIIDYLESEVN